MELIFKQWTTKLIIEIKKHSHASMAIKQTDKERVGGKLSTDGN